MAHSNISKTDVENLVVSICEENGLMDQSSYNFEDFCQLLSPQMDKIWNAELIFKGYIFPDNIRMGYMLIHLMNNT